MGSKKSEPAPQPVVSVPQPPTMSANIQDYINNYPKLFELEKQYSPQEAQLQLDLLNQYGPQFSDYLVNQQKELTPYTYGLQEQLAKLASENLEGNLPNRLQRSYLDQFRSEIGPNVGSGVGADYVSSNMAKLNEDYSRYYQNLGLSLINRVPMNTVSATTPSFSNPVGNYGFGDLSNYNASTYGSYIGGLTNVPYYTNPSKNRFSGILGAVGTIGGAAIGGYLGGPMGAAAGGAAGSSLGGMF